MTKSHARIHPRLVGAVLAGAVALACAIALACALAGAAAIASTAGAWGIHHRMAHGAWRRDRNNGRRRQRSRPPHRARMTQRRSRRHRRRVHGAHRPRATRGACRAAELTPTVSDLVQVRSATLCLINKVRQQHRERPLRERTTLDAAAESHSADMVRGDYFSHTTPSGEVFGTRIVATGYVPEGWSYELGENIECGTLSLATPSAAVQGWMRSPEHRANILNGEFRDSGIGVAPAAPAIYSNGQPGATYTQDFGALAPH